MLTGAAVLKQTSPKFAYFYHLLRQYEHYVPFWQKSSSDILDAVRWLRQRDDEAREMAEAARALVIKYVGRQARLCYLATLMRRIGRLTRCVDGHE